MLESSTGFSTATNSSSSCSQTRWRLLLSVVTQWILSRCHQAPLDFVPLELSKNTHIFCAIRSECECFVLRKKLSLNCCFSIFVSCHSWMFKIILCSEVPMSLCVCVCIVCVPHASILMLFMHSSMRPTVCIAVIFSGNPESKHDHKPHKTRINVNCYCAECSTKLAHKINDAEKFLPTRSRHRIYINIKISTHKLALSDGAHQLLSVRYSHLFYSVLCLFAFYLFSRHCRWSKYYFCLYAGCWLWASSLVSLFVPKSLAQYCDAIKSSGMQLQLTDQMARQKIKTKREK